MKYKYYIKVKQYQLFEFESDTPITKDEFWDKHYHLGSADLDSNIIEWEQSLKAD